ncbi:hypothetical protein GCM10010365_46080 [Streptomyces poonensis]|uniref:Nitroreductase domain-containing protein n=1 Tax=Streptomyces poonensis TaxID=68255 RepID=A0A918PRK3_9ACTN|nr:hypothetical protein GCM10010365_46080 [Streptomyces poonensis]
MGREGGLPEQCHARRPALEHAVTAAVTAPSAHHTRPWRFRSDPPARTVQARVTVHRGAAIRWEAPSTCPWAARSSVRGWPWPTSTVNR